MLYNDINLIPSKKSGTKSAKALIYSLLIILVLSYVGIYFVYEPLKDKEEKQSTLDDLNSQISSYGTIATDYIQATDEYNEYIQKTKILRETLKDDFTMMDEMSAFAYACPPGVKITNFNISEGSITIGCFGDNYDKIAAYITNLESVEFFEDIKYSAIVYTPVDEKESYTFTITIKVRQKG